MVKCEGSRYILLMSTRRKNGKFMHISPYRIIKLQVKGLIIPLSCNKVHKELQNT